MTNKRSDVRPATASQTFHPTDAQTFIADNLRLLPAPSLPEIRLYTAHAASGLWRLAGRTGDGADSPPPYWAYHWAGGTVLARHILDHPKTVRGRRILDLGCGSGVVGIAAGLSGAASVAAADVDLNAESATRLNAAANGIVIETTVGDMTTGAVPDVDLILVGDLFYDEALAASVLPFLTRCRAAGIAVLVGDPGRSSFPRREFRLVAEYPVEDFGDAISGERRIAGVFSLG